MEKIGLVRSGLAAALGLVLAACGGGGDTGEQNNSLSTLQQAFQEAYTEGTSSITTALPASGVPSSGTHYAFTTRYALVNRLSATPQATPQTHTALSATLPLPNFNNWYASGVLINGNVLRFAHVSAPASERVRTEGTSIAWESLASDGTTVASTTRYTSFESIPLTGLIADAPAEVRTWGPLAVLSTNTTLLKPSTSFQAGSRYFKRQSVRQGDLVILGDCNGFTTAIDPSPCGTAATLEAVFPHTFGGRAYILADGPVQTLQGRRAWIAATPVSTSVSPTTAYMVLLEYKGGVVHGLLQRDGTPLRARLADGTVVDYSLRFNQQAVQSLQAAVSF